MATFVAGTKQAIRFDEFDVQDSFDPPGATFTTQPTVYRVSLDPGSYDELTGSFTYNKSKDLVGGTAKTWTAKDDGETIFNITGMALSVTAASPFVNSGNSQGFLGLVFAGNDAITGSGFDDLLRGYNGNDTINGGGGLDTIEGGAGNDMLNGGIGADSLTGGIGNDLYIVDDLGDAVVEAVNGGADLVESTVDFILGDNIESLNLSGGADIDGTGNALANIINGNQGANLLNGLDGNDRIFGADLNDTILGGAGLDSLSGGINDDSLSGDNGNDTLVGAEGKDTLDGGTGADVMTGGADDDLYFVDLITDKVIEAAAPGTDEVKSQITYTLGVNVENLTLLGAGNIDGSGNTAANSLTGNDGNNKLNGGVGADAMAGGLGDDTYIVDNAGDTVTETGPGIDSVQSLVTFTLGADLEHLTLTGTLAIDGTGNTLANKITGNANKNNLTGGDGNDTLDGGAGADTLTGGADDDTYILDNAGDKVIESGGGLDEVQSTFALDLSLAGYEQIEYGKLFGTASAKLTGNDLNNILTGNAGANVIDGGIGADEMAGGGGNDTYLVDDFLDKVVETLNAGIDTVTTNLSVYTLGNDVENLNMLATGVTPNTGTGNELANKITAVESNLFGLGGNDTLIGGFNLDGGTGADLMAGGNYDNTYVVDDKGDIVQEAAGNTEDTVKSSISYALTANVEHLILTDTAINGIGNNLGNTITGNDQDNLLNGLTASDKMFGGKGNDTYIVDNTFDTADETGGDGNDTVKSSASKFTLTAGVETLILTGKAGIEGRGSDDDNTIIGNAGNNRLAGNGGADLLLGGAGNDVLDGFQSDSSADTLDGGVGADRMTLGAGDTAIVDNAADIVEGGGPGSIVKSSVTYSLQPLTNIEELQLTGTKAINGTGSANANRIIGNGAANILNGGAGADTLDGGGGNDTYIVDFTNDQIIETGFGATGGIDSVKSDVSFSLIGTNLENLTLTGLSSNYGWGNAFANVVIGNNAGNDLLGWEGNDTLIGGGGSDWLSGGDGTDSMAGGTGDDVYGVGSIGERVTELVNGGTDKVQSSVTYSLGANLENLQLTGGDNINGFGNGLANQITGNTGNNIIDGNAGADEMAGGAGNDTYYVDNVADQVAESPGAGTDDEIITKVVIGPVAEVEHYTFNVAVAVNFTGDAVANRLTGGSAADTLDGGDGSDTLSGGAGADSMTGGIGDDIYKVDNIGDQLSEAGGDGIDTVETLISFTLGADFENLTLTGIAAISGTGNALGNIITGNGGGNMLFGLDGSDTIDGGAGNDIITGGKGNDIVDAALGNDTIRYASASDGSDIIANFDGNATGGQDLLNLEALFDDLGVLAADRAARVQIIDNGLTVDVAVDTDGDAIFDLAVATLNTTADDIITAGSAGADVILGT